MHFAWVSPTISFRMRLLALFAVTLGACGSSDAEPPSQPAAEACTSKWQSVLSWDNPLRNMTEVRVQGEFLYAAAGDLLRRPLAGGPFERVAEVGRSIGDFRIGEDGGATLLLFSDRLRENYQGAIDVMAFPPGGGAPVLLHTLKRATDPDASYSWGPAILDRNAVYAIKNMQRSAAILRVDLAGGVETSLLQAEPEGEEFSTSFTQLWNTDRWIIATHRSTWAASKTGQPGVQLASRSEKLTALGASPAGQVLWWESGETRDTGRLMTSTPENIVRVPLNQPVMNGFRALRAWPLDDGGWLVAGHESFVDGEHVSLVRVGREGGATRVACDPINFRFPLWGQPTASGFFLKVSYFVGVSEVVYVPWN